MERFDFNYPPYDFLNARQREMLQKSVNIAFFKDNEVIIEEEILEMQEALERRKKYIS